LTDRERKLLDDKSRRVIELRATLTHIRDVAAGSADDGDFGPFRRLILYECEKTLDRTHD
jgi:hypothetical protein